jgi:hypothetical protein
VPRAKAPTERWASGGWIAEPNAEQVAALATRQGITEPVARAILTAAMEAASFRPPPSAAQTAAALADARQRAAELGRAINALGDDARNVLSLTAQGPALQALRQIDLQLGAPGLIEAERNELGRAREAWEAEAVKAASLGRDLLRRMAADIVTLTVTADHAQQSLEQRGRGNPHALDAKIGKAVLDVLASAGVPIDRGKNSRARDILQDVLQMNGFPPEGAETIIRRWQGKNR